MNPTIFQQISELEQQGEHFAVCTIVESRGSTPRRTGSKMIVKRGGEILGSVGGGEVEERARQEALKAITENTAKMLHYSLNDPQKGDPGICGGEVDIFIEPICPSSKIIVIGMGHVGKAVAHLAKWMGYRVAVSDDRPEFGTALAQEADETWIGPIGEIADHLQVSADSFIVLTTRNADLDIEGLPGLLNTGSKYIGVIGSRRRWAVTREGLLRKGVPPDQVDRVQTPIGLKIGAETPEEIAVSILAEIISIRSNHG